MNVKQTQVAKNNMLQMPLLRTKLYPPKITADMVLRNDLLHRLERNRQRPLTVISAPAGFGKSILASMWLHESNRPFGWISLDEADNNLFTFLTYLLASIETIFPDLELLTASLLNSSSLPDVPIVARYLLNDLEQIDEPFSLALDDVHHIHEQSILSLLDEICAHPPRNLHLLLIGRWDPAIRLASSRAAGQITEIRTRDLRFKTEEAGLFLQNLLQREVNEQVAAQWVMKSEGWAAALRLSAIWLQHYNRPDDTEVRFAGANDYLQDFLFVEVLKGLPEPQLSWLLKTSLLDRFCAPLCEAVCQEENATLTGKDFLKWLNEKNLFLIDLDGQHHWFRFHHLFQEQLQNQLQQERSIKEVRTYYSRASHWYAANGWIDEAIQYAIKADNIDYAAELFAGHRHQLYDNEDWLRLERWLSWFPNKYVERSPVLLVTKGFLVLTRGHVTNALQIRDQVQALLSSLPEDSNDPDQIYGDLAFLNQFDNQGHAWAETVIPTALLMLEHLPPEAHYLRARALNLIADGYHLSGNIERSITIIREALSQDQWPRQRHARFHDNLTNYYYRSGNLTIALETALQGLQVAQEFGISTLIPNFYYYIGLVYYLHNDIDKAQSQLRQVVEHPVLTSAEFYSQSVCTLVRILHAQGKYAEAHEIIETASGFHQENAYHREYNFVRAVAVELALDEQNLNKAKSLATLVDFENCLPYASSYYIPKFTLVRLLLVEDTSHSFEQALHYLAQPHRRHDAFYWINSWGLQALVHYAQQHLHAAFEKLLESLTSALPGGFIRNYVDFGPKMAELLSVLFHSGQVQDEEMLHYIETILAAFPKTQSHTTDVPRSRRVSDAEQLTARQLDVLGLLATELTPQEIAEELSISTATVRTHIKHIYSKLDVHSRFEALQSASELGLI